MDDRRLRYEIYRTFARTGRAPTGDELAAWAGGVDPSRAALQRLHDAHAVVLDGEGEIRMALPFSAVETDHVVTSGSHRWWANCAWDALAIPAALSIDAEIRGVWMDSGQPAELAVADGQLTSTEGVVHFQIPARQWWDDIIET
jgi:hypothetical protein